MTQSQLATLVEVTPVMRTLTIPQGQKAEAINSYIPVVVNEIAVSHDWDFVTDVADESSVVSQAGYALQGNHHDCREIINVRYGSDLDMLKKMRPIDMDEFETNRDLTGVGWWVPSGKDSGGYPKITLYATPTAVATIRYRYRKRNISLGDLPEQFHHIVISGVIKSFFPEYKGLFDRELAEMKDYYDYGESGEHPARRDPVLVDRNNTRANLYGWS